MQQSVDAILMASGASSRFETGDKLLAPFRGKPLVLHTVELVVASRLFETVFLVYAQPQVAALVKGLPVHAIHNSRPQRGMCESIRLGVQASRAAHTLFFPCDQPLLDQHTLEQILAQRQAGRIVVPYYKERPGSPVLFSATFRQELLHLKNGEIGRTLQARHPGAVVAVQVPEPQLLEDVDTLEDLKRLQ